MGHHEAKCLSFLMRLERSAGDSSYNPCYPKSTGVLGAGVWVWKGLGRKKLVSFGFRRPPVGGWRMDRSGGYSRETTAVFMSWSWLDHLSMAGDKGPWMGLRERLGQGPTFLGQQEYQGWTGESCVVSAGAAALRSRGFWPQEGVCRGGGATCWGCWRVCLHWGGGPDRQTLWIVP